MPGPGRYDRGAPTPGSVAHRAATCQAIGGETTGLRPEGSTRGGVGARSAPVQWVCSRFTWGDRPGSLRSMSHQRPTGRGAGRHAPSAVTLPGTAPEEESWLDEASASRALAAPRRAASAGARDLDNEGIIPVLARAVREVEAGVQRGPVTPSARTKFQVVALLVREERARVKADTDQHRGPARRAAQAPRRDRHDPRQDRRPRHLAARAARRGRRRLRRGQGAASARCSRAAGVEAEPEEAEPEPPSGRAPPPPSAASCPQSVDLPPAGQPVPRPRLLRRRAPQAAAAAGWPAGSCSARCSAPSSTPRRRLVVHGAARARPRCRRPAASS